MLFSLLLCIACGATAEAPQPGGELNVGTVYVTLAPLSWDPQDWNWKANHDTSMVREQLFAADLELSQRKGGPYSFVADAYIPEDAVRGDLAESWRWLDDASFSARPGSSSSSTQTQSSIQRHHSSNSNNFPRAVSVVKRRY
ncbi:MAG: hypothetical protein AAF529_25680 [Pseudomonadota bacterium]